MAALHDPDESISARAAGALCALTLSVASTLQMVLEGAVLQMLEVDETISTWAICLQALRNIWKQINRQDFRRMLHAVARVSADADIGTIGSWNDAADDRAIRLTPCSLMLKQASCGGTSC